MGLSSAKEERVAILGDSIPYAGGWPTLVTEYLHQNPQYGKALVANICVPSETVSGLSEEGHAGGAFPRPCLHDRLSRVLTQFKPTLILACYGINDGIYQPLDKQRFTAYQNGIKRLKSEAEAAGATVVFITPPPYRPDQEASTGQDIYDKALGTYADWILAQKRQGWKVIDIRNHVKKSISQAKKKNPAFIYAGDGVHPGAEGHRFIAEAVCQGLSKQLGTSSKIQFPEGAPLTEATNRQAQTRNEWLNKTKHQRPEIPGYAASIPKFKDQNAVTNEWNGFEKCDFTFEGRKALIVFPKKAAQGNPWIWRPEFFGYEPEVDIELLNQGFAVAYIDMQNMYGAPPAMKIMDAFYRHATENYELSRKPVLEAFSRGGLFAFNWAALHPLQVSAIYAVVPVCDFKSWPAGKGKGEHSKDDWQRLLAMYGMTEAEALAWKKNPVDNLRPLIKAHIPVICVVRTQDTVVPYEENAKILAERYKKLGGRISIIEGPGNHMDRSLKNPLLVVNFIMAATGHQVPSRVVCLGDKTNHASK